MDFDKLDEAIENLQNTLSHYAVGNERMLGWDGRDIVAAHRVLELLAKIGIEPVYNWWREELCLYLAAPESNPGVEVTMGSGELPAAVLAAVESDEFKAWVAAEKASMCRTCGKKKGEKRIDNGLPAGVHCDSCWAELVRDCRKRSW